MTQITEHPDLRVRWADCYRAVRKPQLVDIPARAALVVDGVGAPTGETFREAIAALYGIAYTLKFALKPRLPDFPMFPLEASWDEPPTDLDAWRWSAQIAVPDGVTATDLKRASAAARAKHPEVHYEQVKLRRRRSEHAAQVLHIGPYALEARTIERLRAFITEAGYAVSGRQQEIYLSDPNRTAPERLRTIIRYAIRRTRR